MVFSNDAASEYLTQWNLIPIFDEHHAPTAILSIAQPIETIAFDVQHMLFSTQLQGAEKNSHAVVSPTTNTDAWNVITTLIRRAKETQELTARFRRVISHEIRTPLAGIKISADIIERYADTLTRKEILLYASDIGSAVREVEAILNTLLHALYEDSQIQQTSLAQHNLVQHCWEEIQVILDHTSTPRTIKFMPSASDIPAEIDVRMFRVLLHNIIINSVRYSPPTEPIIVRLEVLPDAICLTVLDTGIGIKPDDIALVWEPFFRGKNVEHLPGIGMGLFVAKYCVEQHSGAIEIQSTLGQQTSVVVTLPRK